MNILKISKVNHLDLYNFEVENPESATIIVGNAYGIMPYIKPLAQKLCNIKTKPYWFPFSGQECMDGAYSFAQGKQDLGNIVEYINYHNSLPINIIAHCAGSLITLEYLQKSNKPKINKMIIYGLLYQMSRRRQIAERKLINTGVKFNLSEEDWAYNPENAIKNLDFQILFCHSKDKLNIERATEQEMNKVKNLNSHNKLTWFENGYDEQVDNIDNFIDTYISHFKN